MKKGDFLLFNRNDPRTEVNNTSQLPSAPPLEEIMTSTHLKITPFSQKNSKKAWTIVIYQTDRTSRMVVDNTDNYIKTMGKGHVGEDLNITKKRNT